MLIDSKRDGHFSQRTNALRLPKLLAANVVVVVVVESCTQSHYLPKLVAEEVVAEVMAEEAHKVAVHPIPSLPFSMFYRGHVRFICPLVTQNAFMHPTLKIPLVHPCVTP